MDNVILNNCVHSFHIVVFLIQINNYQIHFIQLYHVDCVTVIYKQTCVAEGNAT